MDSHWKCIAYILSVNKVRLLVVLTDVLTDAAPPAPVLLGGVVWVWSPCKPHRGPHQQDQSSVLLPSPLRARAALEGVQGVLHTRYTGIPQGEWRVVLPVGGCRCYSTARSASSLSKGTASTGKLMSLSRVHAKACQRARQRHQRQTKAPQRHTAQPYEQ